MEVLELVQSAACKCGLVSSFNPDEFPGDIQDAGKMALINEILPSLNCDRTLDITVTSRVYQPVGGRIVLKPAVIGHNQILIGYSSKYTAKELGTEPAKFYEAVWALRPGFADNWPQDDLGNNKDVLLWGTDIHLAGGHPIDNGDELWYSHTFNIDFPPMRVEEVLEESSRVKYEYVYRTEFEQILKTALPGVYTTEEYEDKIIVFTNGTSELKRIVLPVPLQVINADNTYAGQIIAPPKFRKYLIDAIAVSLAIEYGLSTVDLMKAEAAQSYQLLKKNKPQPLHKANVSEEINSVLRHGINGRRFYAGF